MAQDEKGEGGRGLHPDTLKELTRLSQENQKLKAAGLPVPTVTAKMEGPFVDRITVQGQSPAKTKTEFIEDATNVGSPTPPDPTKS